MKLKVDTLELLCKHIRFFIHFLHTCLLSYKLTLFSLFCLIMSSSLHRSQGSLKICLHYQYFWVFELNILNYGMYSRLSYFVTCHNCLGFKILSIVFDRLFCSKPLKLANIIKGICYKYSWSNYMPYFKMLSSNTKSIDSASRSSTISNSCASWMIL